MYALRAMDLGAHKQPRVLAGFIMLLLSVAVPSTAKNQSDHYDDDYKEQEP